jgi:hypothetical protein
MNRALACLALLLVIAACGVGNRLTPSPSPSVPPSVAPTASAIAAPESPVEGLVIAIEQTGLNEVQGFTIRTTSGEEWTFRIGVLDNGDVFPPSHLNAHQADAYPVLVTFHVEGDELVATHLDDGTPPS